MKKDKNIRIINNVKIILRELKKKRKAKRNARKKSALRYGADNLNKSSVASVMSPLSHNLTTANYNNNLINSLENRLLEGYTKTYNEKKAITTPQNETTLQNITQPPLFYQNPQTEEYQQPYSHNFNSLQEEKDFWRNLFQSSKTLPHLRVSLKQFNKSLTDNFLEKINGKNKNAIINDIIDAKYANYKIEEPDEPDFIDISQSKQKRPRKKIIVEPPDTDTSLPPRRGRSKGYITQPVEPDESPPLQAKKAKQETMDKFLKPKSLTRDTSITELYENQNPLQTEDEGTNVNVRKQTVTHKIMKNPPPKEKS
jgi:hypothetical protein